MQRFQCWLFVLKRPYICYYIIWMTVPLNLTWALGHWKLTKPVIATKPKINLSNLKTSNIEKVLRSKNCLLNYNDNQNFQDISYFQSVNLKATTGGVLKKAVLKNFAIFTKKPICVRVSFVTFLRTPKLKNICRFLWISSWTKNLLITQQSKRSLGV